MSVNLESPEWSARMQALANGATAPNSGFREWKWV